MNNDRPEDRFDDLDARFTAASNELRRDLDRIDPPVLAGAVVDRARSTRTMVAAAAALVAVIAAGLVALIPGRNDSVTISSPSPSPDVSVPSEVLFGADVVQITASAPSEYILPVQSPAAAWNADGTRLLLYRTTSGGDGGHVLIDVVDEVPRSAPTALEIAPSDIEQVYWSPVDPDVFHFVSGNSLLSFDVTKNVSVVERSFEACESVDPGQGTGPSWDGAVIGLLCVGDVNRLMGYQFATGEVTTAATNGDEAPIVLPSGGGFLLPVSGGPDLVLDADLSPTGVVLDLDDAARASTIVDGVDVIVGPSFDGEFIGSLVAYPTDGSAPFVVIGPATGFPSPPGGSSVSATAWSQAGSVVVAFAPGEPASQLDGRILIADVRTASVQVVATHRASGRIDYWSDTFVSIDPSGTKVVFSTDRSEGIAVDSYVVNVEG